ncbi:NAD(P)H-dependent oxidoreductase [Actinomycetaceae bacterium TAE3-ERU4]|nr:NAD(P)H-dependent oxidoreductase [Actinomycetaceae bacterium TAE3-ERU4]
MKKKISVLIGSLRGASVARKIAHNVIPMFSDDFEVEIVEIADLPLYNFDYDDPSVPEVALPAEYTRFRETIKASDGVLFVTPENNRCIPACLKNAVDICSKPNNDVAWKNKPAAIISHSIGRMGGYSSHKNLKLALSYFAMPMVPQPEVFLSNSHDLVNEEGKITAESTLEFLQGYINQFSDLVKNTTK